MKNTLLIGYTDWIDQTFLSHTFPEDFCVCVGTGNGLKNGRKLRLLEKEEIAGRQELKSLLGTWMFQKIVFFSESLGLFRDMSFDELGMLSNLLDLLSGETQARVIVLTGCNRQHTGTPIEEKLITAAVENLLEAGHSFARNTVFVRCPWVCNVDPKRFDPALKELIAQAARSGGNLSVPLPSGQEIAAVSPDDLSELIFRMFDRWVEEDDPHSFSIGSFITCKELGDALEKAIPELTCSYDDRGSVIHLTGSDTFAREKYGWFAHYDIISDLTGGLDPADKAGKNALPGTDAVAHPGDRSDPDSENKKRLQTADLLKALRRGAELVAGFLIMEWLVRFSRTQVKFQLIDFRLLYVLIIGLMYNIPMGLGAGALASLSMILGYQREGIGFLTLFYEPTNWFAFIIYFTVGAVCGYIRTKDRDSIAFATQESRLLREKYHFLRELFLEAQQEKQEYRQQIITSQDSFGKIFRVTRQLDVISPHLVFVQAMSVIEEIMENQSVSICSVGHNRHFARLEAASRGLGIPRSLDLDGYEQVLAAIRETGIWTNVALEQDKPMYVAGVVRDDQIVLLVMIWKAQFGQMSLYYSNLLKILCGLISTSLLRSLDYQNATRSNRYVEDTQLMLAGPFREELEITWSMNMKKIANYTLHHLKGEGMDAVQIARKLTGRIRENDMMGLVGGKVYLLVSQSTVEGIEIMQSRFEQLGISLYQAAFEEVMEKADALLKEEHANAQEEEGGSQ